MEEDKYAFKKIYAEFQYDFYSEGPKGTIRKIVRFKCMEIFPTEVYNLSFGDWNEELQEVDHMIITGNEDKRKVLVTVAASVLEFTNQHPDKIIFLQASTASRTRLYQMGISSFWAEIERSFSVFGYKNEKWFPFGKGINYEAFLIKRN